MEFYEIELVRRFRLSYNGYYRHRYSAIVLPDKARCASRECSGRETYPPGLNSNSSLAAPGTNVASGNMASFTCLNLTSLGSDKYQHLESMTTTAAPTVGSRRVVQYDRKQKHSLVNRNAACMDHFEIRLQRLGGRRAVMITRDLTHKHIVSLVET